MLFIIKYTKQTMLDNFKQFKSGRLNYFTHETTYLLSKELISFVLKGFWEIVMVNFDVDQYITLIFKVQFDVDGYKTINRSITFNKDEFLRVQNYFWGGLDIANANYLIDTISQIVISYYIPSKEKVKTSKFNKDRKQIKIPTSTTPSALAREGC